MQGSCSNKSVLWRPHSITPTQLSTTPKPPYHRHMYMRVHIMTSSRAGACGTVLGALLGWEAAASSARPRAPPHS